jgi:AcrR family transcriptional regulator
LQATRDQACSQGYQALSVTGLISAAGVSSKTFYEMFSGVDDCFIAVYDEAIAEVEGVMRPAYMRPGSWAERVRAGLEALLLLLEGERELAGLIFVEASKARDVLAGRRTRLVEMLRLVLDSGRSGECAHAIPPLTDELVVEGALAIIRTRIASEQCVRVLLDDLMRAITYAYLGPAAAEAQLKRLRPTGPAPGAVTLERPEARIRVTYRTLRVLTALAERPGSTNKQIAEAAEITDAGQISKLLRRLAEQRLIENEGPSRNGAPKSWRLTEQGMLLQRRAHRDLQERTSRS